MYLVRRLVVMFFMGVSLVLAGCASAPQAPSTVGMDLGGDKTYTFRNVNENGNRIDGNSIVKSIIETAVSASSSYRKSGRMFQKYGAPELVKGVEVSQLPNGFKVSYVNGEYYGETKNIYVTKSSAVFGYSVAEGPGSITVTITPPKNIETIVARNPIYLPYDKLDADEKLANDLKKIFSSLAPKVAYMKSINGEVDSPFGVDAIMANFKRKCSYFSPQTMGGYGCSVDRQDIKLEFQPYKSGSKITYNFNVTYYLSDKSESSYSAGSTKSVIAAIEKIVKD